MKMRKHTVLMLLCTTLVIGMFWTPLWAQSTAVTFQVTDADAQSWNNGTWTVQLVAPPTGPQPTQFVISGTTTVVPNQQQSGVMSSTGAGSVTLTPDTSIAPSGTQWAFNFCPQTLPAPCLQQLYTITGTTQALTVTPPGIRISISGIGTRAYLDIEVTGANIGSQYYNLNDSTIHLCTMFVVNCVWTSIGTSLIPVPNIGVSPGNINFGSVQISVPSPTSLVTISNQSTTSGSITSITVSGTNSSDFIQTGGSCIGTLIGGASCQISIVFTPSVLGVETATLIVTSNGQNPTLSIPLQGTGTSAASYPLNVLAGNTGGTGTVVSTDNPPSINCNFGASGATGTCSGNYPTGTSLTLIATAAPLNTFVRFAGDGCSTSPCTITVTSSTVPITATFNPPAATNLLNVLPIGHGAGTITGNISASQINCVIALTGIITGICSQRVATGALVVLTEVPSGSSTFVIWGGVPGCSSATTCTFNLSVDTTIGATFNPPTGGTPFSLVQTIPQGTAGTNNITGNWMLAQNAGDLIVCGAEWFDNTTTVSSVADTSLNTYTQLASSPKVVAAANGQTSLTAVYYYAQNIAAAAAGANTTTFTLNANGPSRVMHCKEYAGPTTTPLDVSAGASGQDNAGSAPPSSGNVTPTAGDLLDAFTALTVSVSSSATGWVQDILNTYSAGMSFVQKHAGPAGTALTESSTFNSSVTSGDTVIGAVFSTGASDTLSSVVTSKSQTCTITAHSPSTQASAGSAWMYNCFNVTGGVYPWYVTATFASGTSKRSVWSVELSNGGRTPAFDADVAGSGTTGTAVNTPTLTPSNSGDFYYSFVNDSAGISSVNSPWTTGSSGGNTNYDAYQLNASGAQATNMTSAASGAWASIEEALFPGSLGGDDSEHLTNAAHSAQANAVTPSSTTNNWVSFIAAYLMQAASATVNSITVLGGGNGNGSVVGNVGGVNCIITNGVAGTTNCTITSSSPITITLTAAPSSGSSFTAWNNGCGTNPVCVLTNVTVQSFVAASFASFSGPFT